jgi:hypothetical protein
MADASTAPKVFISYSWTTDEHVEWVAALGERLMSDGIVVVLDQWSLKDGQDLNDFMEQMVKDPGIKRVIIISDAKYAVKADDRKGGVGTETQIISQEVYASVEQTKFVPILRERDSEGKAHLPIYLKSRKYIDFSNPDNDAEAYEQLLRNIYERPRRKMPPLGQAPSHLFDEKEIAVSSAQKGKRFREFVVGGRGNCILAFNDFVDEFLLNLEDLRMTYSREEAGTWCKRIQENIETATTHRDILVDAIQAGCSLPSEDFMPVLITFLERLLPYQERPASVSPFFECSQDNYKLLCYEIFLYTFATFVKAKKYSEARQMIDHLYVAPRTFGGTELESNKFDSFNMYAESLETVCAKETRRYSVMADLIHNRATNKHIRFSEVLQSDVLLWIAEGSWYPRCLVFGGSVGKLELFLRAATAEGYQPLRVMLKLNSPKDLLKRLSEPDRLRSLQSEKYWRFRPEDCLNLQELSHIWSSSQR